MTRADLDAAIAGMADNALDEVKAGRRVPEVVHEHVTKSEYTSNSAVAQAAFGLLNGPEQESASMGSQLFDTQSIPDTLGSLYCELMHNWLQLQVMHRCLKIGSERNLLRRGRSIGGRAHRKTRKPNEGGD